MVEQTEFPPCHTAARRPSGSATNQPLSPPAGVQLVKVGVVNLEAGHVQCFGEQGVALLPCVVRCRADTFNQVFQLG
jgi:hypothetical protein